MSFIKHPGPFAVTVNYRFGLLPFGLLPLTTVNFRLLQFFWVATTVAEGDEFDAIRRVDPLRAIIRLALAPKLEHLCQVR